MRDSVSIQQANLCARYNQGAWNRQKAGALRLLRWTATVFVALGLVAAGAVLMRF
ncbi:MAG: hypothetical protein IPK13_14070 [Deltaproteobacteria bacterium]|nr:hypothetical protein [Deltaproteobacteria bacterium]